MTNDPPTIDAMIAELEGRIAEQRLSGPTDIKISLDLLSQLLTFIGLQQEMLKGMADSADKAAVELKAFKKMMRPGLI